MKRLKYLPIFGHEIWLSLVLIAGLSFFSGLVPASELSDELKEKITTLQGKDLLGQQNQLLKNHQQLDNPNPDELGSFFTEQWSRNCITPNH